MISRLHRAFLCRCFRRTALAFFNEGQNGREMEKPRAFDLPRLADRNAAEMSLARAFVKFSAAESREMFRADFGRANPHGQAVGSFRE